MTPSPQPLYQEYATPLGVGITVLLAAIGWWLAHDKDRKSTAAAREQENKRTYRAIYQRLELASVDLFRWEADHPAVTRQIWEECETRPAPGTVEDDIAFNYLCQVLNLFEMAVEFRKEGVVTPEVFSGWVNWFFRVSQTPGCAYYWPKARLDYTLTLRGIMDKGVALRDPCRDPDEARKDFFAEVGRRMNCGVVTAWLASPKREPQEPGEVAVAP